MKTPDEYMDQAEAAAHSILTAMTEGARQNAVARVKAYTRMAEASAHIAAAKRPIDRTFADGLPA